MEGSYSYLIQDLYWAGGETEAQGKGVGPSHSVHLPN